MTIGGEEVWTWLKKAPLPVVLSLCLTSFTVLATWLYAVEGEQAKQAVAVAEAKKDAEQAKKAAEGMDAKLEKANEKLDKLLEAVIEMKAEQKAAKKKEKQ